MDHAGLDRALHHQALGILHGALDADAAADDEGAALGGGADGLAAWPGLDAGRLHAARRGGLRAGSGVGVVGAGVGYGVRPMAGTSFGGAGR